MNRQRHLLLHTVLTGQIARHCTVSGSESINVMQIWNGRNNIEIVKSEFIVNVSFVL